MGGNEKKGKEMIGNKEKGMFSRNNNSAVVLSGLS